MVQIKNFLSLAAVISAVTAHPGHNPQEEALERRAYYDSVTQTKRSLDHCAAKIKARGLNKQSHLRREALASTIRQKRDRDASTVLNTTHLSNETSINMDVTEDYPFSGGNSSCILVPEVTQGPYYVSGEFIRKNITETQLGVPMTMDIQIIDVDTCEPVPDVYIDFWHCNATGVYSGIAASGNGDSTDAANVNATFLRGIAETDIEGVATFETIVPGHYTIRANHIHILTHTNATINVNSTITGGTVQHVGQLFFDQSLLETVESTYPYSTNTQAWTQNSEDSILTEETATEGVDPVVEYVLLGDDVTEGVLAWVVVGVDMGASQSVSAAASYYRTGGVMDDSEGSTGGGGSGGDAPPSGNSTGITNSTSS